MELAGVVVQVVVGLLTATEGRLDVIVRFLMKMHQRYMDDTSQ